MDDFFVFNTIVYFKGNFLSSSQIHDTGTFFATGRNWYHPQKSVENDDKSQDPINRAIPRVTNYVKLTIWNV